MNDEIRKDAELVIAWHSRDPEVKGIDAIISSERLARHIISQSPKATPDNGAEREAFEKIMTDEIEQQEKQIEEEPSPTYRMLYSGRLAGARFALQRFRALSHPVKADHVPDTGKMVNDWDRVYEFLSDAANELIGVDTSARSAVVMARDIASQHTTPDGKGEG